MRIKFTKMHGAGNDFVMIDAISQPVVITPERARKLADRHFGVGCDQILIVEPPSQPENDFRYRIFNQDGSEVENCGNGARCFAVFVRLRRLTDKTSIRAETAGGILILRVLEDDQVTVDMGEPVLEPAKIPFLANAQASLYSLPLPDRTLEIGAISMGNPHAVTLVENVLEYPVIEIGRQVEKHEYFPRKVNAGFMQLVSPKEIHLRVFERGVGETLACGTGACAAVVSGVLRGLLTSPVSVKLPGGTLNIEWQGVGHPVLMTGPATVVFHGQVRI